MAVLRSRELPAERGFEDRIARERGEERLAGQSEAQHTVNFDDGLAHAGLRVAVVLRVAGTGDISAADDLTLDGFELFAALREEGDRLAFVEREQQFLRDRVVAVTLLENLQRASGQVAQDDRVGFQVRRDAGEVYVVDAGGQVERQILAGDEEILVVDGERGRGVWLRLRCLVLRGGEKREAEEREQKFVHGSCPPLCL